MQKPSDIGRGARNVMRATLRAMRNARRLMWMTRDRLHSLPDLMHAPARVRSCTGLSDVRNVSVHAGALKLQGETSKPARDRLACTRKRQSRQGFAALVAGPFILPFSSVGSSAPSWTMPCLRYSIPRSAMPSGRGWFAGSRKPPCAGSGGFAITSAMPACVRPPRRCRDVPAGRPATFGPR